MSCMKHHRPRQSSEIAVYAHKSCSATKDSLNSATPELLFWNRVWVAFTAFPKLKAASKHSAETHRTDHMEAVYFQDSTVSLRCQFYWSWTSSSQSVPAQFSLQSLKFLRLQAHTWSSQTQTGHSCLMLHFS